MFFTKILYKSINFKRNLFYLIILLYAIIGVYLSLNVGITHDELHNFIVGEANKKKILNIFFNKHFQISELEGLNTYYGSGFHLLTIPVDNILNFILDLDYISSDSKGLLLKHPSVFIFFIISGIYFRKIIYHITKNKNYSSVCAFFYLSYPYLFGHSLFNIKDIPFLSVWLICTYYIIDISNYFLLKKNINSKKILILAALTAYLLSIRISGILIFFEYLIFFIFAISYSNYNYFLFFKNFFKQIFVFIFSTLVLFYIFSPSYWHNPLEVINGIKVMSQHEQTVCTITLGECMKAQNLPTSYMPIWFFFKLPLLILFGFIYFIHKEKKIFSSTKNILTIAPLMISSFSIIFLLIILNVNLYDEIRQVMFLIPLFFIISMSALFILPNKLSYVLLYLFIIFFFYQNIKIFPYNYVWLNNLSIFTGINNKFELDYWGVSSKKIASFINQENIDENICIISIRDNGIKDFVENKKACFLPFSKLHQKNKRPFYVALTERSIKKGVPNNCTNIYNEKINLNFSRENLIMAKVFKCD